jgi:hypothetical protein
MGLSNLKHFKDNLLFGAIEGFFLMPKDVVE